MLNKEKFIEYIKYIISYNKELDKWVNILGYNVFESRLCTEAFNISDSLVRLISDNNEEVIDLINWWLYEDVEKVLFNKGEEIEVNTLDKLYDFIKETYYDNKGN